MYYLLFALSQNKVEFDILFGSYENDHYTKTFKAEERHWVLKNSVLSYSIDANNTTYLDTITLSDSSINRIINQINKTKINPLISKKLKSDIFEKEGWKLIIKGNIAYKNEKYQFSISANSPLLLEDDSDTKQIKALETLLYQLIEE